jgi:hypothetical protein
MVRENLRDAQSRQKRYGDHRWRELSFEVGGYVYLKVSPIRGLWRFKVRGKFAPRFISSFKITGEKRRVEDRIFWVSFPIHLNLEGEIHFKGVGLSHPKIPNFEMWLKFTKF